MKILFLCNKSPYPPIEGGPLAMNANITGLLNLGHFVKVLAMNTNKYIVNPDDLPDDYRQNTGIEYVYNDLSIKPLEAFFNLFSSRSYHVERFISKAFERKLMEILQQDQYDIVQLEMLYMTPYVETIRKYSDAKIVLRSHNIEHLIWNRITQNTRNRLKKAYLKTLTRKLKKYELATLENYDGIVTISNNDAAFFRSTGTKTPITDVPFGVEISRYPFENRKYEFPTLFHIGSMNWVPNEEGIRWFLDHTWPGINNKFPELKFYLAGREMPDWLTKSKINNVVVLGEVPDAKEFITSKAIMIVPLFSGSGIRIKILEGMAMGKAIISTGIGAEGIDYTKNENILIAETPEEFLNAIEKCISDREFCDQTGNHARKLIEEKYNLKIVTKKLEAFYHTILEN
ncbi:MAG: glycosyltransferase [Bacteroidales bacterium]|nr:glycosyltransferase [Bacteroidales bacterium]